MYAKQGPDDVFVPWRVGPKTDWVPNYLQEKLQSEQPDHPYAKVRGWFVSQLDQEKSTVTIKSKKHLTKLGVDIDIPKSKTEYVNFFKMIGAPKFQVNKTSGNEEAGKVQAHLKIHPIHSPHWPKALQVLDALEDLFQRAGFTPDPVRLGQLEVFFRMAGNGQINHKYETDNNVEVWQEGKTYHLMEIVEWLEGLGYKFTKNKTFAEIFRKTRNFFNTNPFFRGTQKQLAKRLGCSYRSLQYVLKLMRLYEEVDIKLVGNNSPGNPRHSLIISNILRTSFSHEPETQQSILTTNSKQGRVSLRTHGSLNTHKYSIIELLGKQVIPEGIRNLITFLVIVELKHLKKGELTENEALALLEKLCDYGGSGVFSEKERRRCIRSALNPRYKNIPGYKTYQMVKEALSDANSQPACEHRGELQ